jgi:uncharacterized protein (UPF0548 family)
VKSVQAFSIAVESEGWRVRVKNRTSMDIRLLGARPDLTRWEQRKIDPHSAGPPMAGAFHDLHRRIVAVEPPGPPVPDGPFERAARTIMAYQIFPGHIGDGIARRQPVEIGDTLGMLYRFFPGMKLFFASRVVEKISQQTSPIWRQGFRYQTIAWHPELGAETFCAEKVVETGEVRVYLQAWSRPAWWALPFLPLARRLQLAAGKAALDHLEKVATETGV